MVKTTWSTTHRVSPSALRHFGRLDLDVKWLDAERVYLPILCVKRRKSPWIFPRILYLLVLPFIWGGDATSVDIVLARKFSSFISSHPKYALRAPFSSYSFPVAQTEESNSKINCVIILIVVVIIYGLWLLVGIRLFRVIHSHGIFKWFLSSI